VQESLCETIIPLALALCTDPVADVRRHASAQLGSLLALALELGQAERARRFLGSIGQMASSASCHRRCNFVLLASQLLCGRELPWRLLVTSLLRPALGLADDPVSNVRLTLAQLLAQLLPLDAAAADDESGDLDADERAEVRGRMRVAADRLSADSDRDVLRCAARQRNSAAAQRSAAQRSAAQRVSAPGA
jgi:hypothetical protein